MFSYTLRRLLEGVFVIVGVSVVVFLLLHLSPGDPAQLMLREGASAEEVARVRTNLGLDRPLPEQYGTFVWRALQGDLGASFHYRQSAIEVVIDFLPETLYLSLAALVLSIIVSLPLGILSALRRDSVWDLLGTTFAVLGQAMPPFWLGIVLIFVFAVRLGWFPTSGSGTFSHLILPAVTLSAYQTALFTRLVRSGLLEVLGQDYVRTAHSKGLHQLRVVWKHAMRNTLIPLITVMGIQLGALIAGAIVVETVFAWPGVGRLLILAISSRDYPVIQAGVLLISVLVVLVNIVVDVLYAFIDPRIAYS
ncbi:MAG: nickel ABC transporter permease [Trueperaceae bacterium]